MYIRDPIHISFENSLQSLRISRLAGWGFDGSILSTAKYVPFYGAICKWIVSMELSHSLSMRTEQRQLLTPRMIQSMEILQLPLMALEERIEQEMEVNPTLEF